MIEYSIVITTINVPEVLESIATNLEQFGRKDTVEAIIIGDKKTPVEAGAYVQDWRDKGFNFEYWDLQQQADWLKPFPELAEIIPFNSDNRRNIGYLAAYQRKRPFIISMDDDNYPLPGVDFIAGFKDVGRTAEWDAVQTTTGWYNNCEPLETNLGVEFYPRGFPYEYRFPTENKINTVKRQARLAVQGGLWKGDPDIDAVTRITFPIEVLNERVDNVVLDTTTSCPFNTQNTTLMRDVIPAYYFIVMQQEINGRKIDRYGDIWSGYFAKKAIDIVGDVIGFGEPLAYQKRNAHDLFKDLSQELPGMVLTEKLAKIFNRITGQADDYFTATEIFADGLLREVETSGLFDEEEIEYFRKIYRNIQIWLDTCKELDSQ